MAKLSVIIITKNEEENIRDCLKSVKWADEIVIVDSFSHDRTVEIAKEYTDKILQQEWMGYGRQKNLALEKATGEWVLNIDADERVTQELAREIKEAIQEKQYDGYYIPNKAYFLGKWMRHSGWYPDYHLRLFKKGKGRFNERMVHEAVQAEGKKDYLKGAIEHFTARSIGEYLRRLDKYARLTIKEREGRAGWYRIFFHPPFTFFKMYIIKRGFLDGIHGLILALCHSYYTFSKYARLWEKSSKN
ncbi:glycosyltransferase family 2 protein [bacterium]|nr:glycosyltransferase family 2 protein [bacterium]MBU4310217.1 glycosyltransferase family 2 protein [bacterium]MBU4560787.1 glycosyltransferase family 2 protein [bacterium]MCG2676401.1 glycosyltransferase family 2 protein [bacterium]MCG2677395.1 glycosyltransferase family 2 protein [bacterium]